jgi:hypothetical protein
MNPLAYVAAMIASATQCLKSEFAAKHEATEKRNRPGGRGRYGKHPQAYLRNEPRRRPELTPEALKSIRRAALAVAREKRRVRAVLKHPRRHDVNVVLAARELRRHAA